MQTIELDLSVILVYYSTLYNIEFKNNSVNMLYNPQKPKLLLLLGEVYNHWFPLYKSTLRVLLYISRARIFLFWFKIWLGTATLILVYDMYFQILEIFYSLLIFRINFHSGSRKISETWCLLQYLSFSRTFLVPGKNFSIWVHTASAAVFQVWGPG